MTDTAKTELTVGREITLPQEAAIKSATRVIVSETGGDSQKIERAIREAISQPCKVIVSDLYIKITPFIDEAAIAKELIEAAKQSGKVATRIAEGVDNLRRQGEAAKQAAGEQPGAVKRVAVDFGGKLPSGVIYRRTGLGGTEWEILEGTIREPASAMDQEYAPGAGARRFVPETVFQQRDIAREEVAELKNALEGVTADLKHSRDLHNSALNALDARDQDLRAAAVILAEAQVDHGKQIAALEAEREQYLQERADLTTTKSYIRAAKLEAEVAGLKTSATIWQGVAAELKEQNAEVSRQLAQQKAHSLRLSEELAQARNQVETCRDLEDQSGRIKALEAELVETKKVRDYAYATVLRQDQARETQSVRIKQLEGEIAKEYVKVQSLEARLINTVGQKEYDAVCNRVRLFRERMEAAKAGFESIGNDHTYHNRQIAEMQIGALSEALYNDK